MLKQWQKHSKGVFNTYAYCLMPNHIHFCVQTLPLAGAEEQTASNAKITPHSKVMNNFLAGYVQAINKQEHRKGALLRERFGRIEVTNLDYFRDLICYIHHNPIHHFEMSAYDTWAYSSYHDFFTNQNQPSFLRRDLVLNQFASKDGCQFIKYHEDYKNRKRNIQYESMIREMIEKR
jgi:putative transposase